MTLRLSVAVKSSNVGESARDPAVSPKSRSKRPLAAGLAAPGRVLADRWLAFVRRRDTSFLMSAMHFTKKPSSSERCEDVATACARNCFTIRRSDCSWLSSRSTNACKATRTSTTHGEGRGCEGANTATFRLRTRYCAVVVSSSAGSSAWKSEPGFDNDTPRPRLLRRDDLPLPPPGDPGPVACMGPRLP